MTRIFFALLPSPHSVVTFQPLMQGVAGARWQTPEQLHITLRFIGNIAPHKLDDLVDGLPRGLRLPLIDLIGVGFFKGKQFANALWVRAAPREVLAELHHKLDRHCQTVGLPPERRAYLPHLTVARLSRTAGPIDDWLAVNAGFAAPGICFDRIALMESIRTHDGSRYEEIVHSVAVGRQDKAGSHRHGEHERDSPAARLRLSKSMQVAAYSKLARLF